LSTDTSAGSNSLRSNTGRGESTREDSSPTNGVSAESGTPVRQAPLEAEPARLVYPPVTEERPSSRPVLVAAFAALVLLVAVGVLLIRNGQGSAEDPDPAGTVTVPSGDTQVATVVSQTSFGPGLVLSESQHVTFDQPVSSLTLAVPKQAATVGGGAFDPRIGNLQVLLADGPPMNVRQSLRPGTSVTVKLPAASSQLDVVYVAYHAVARSVPSSQHRAVALVTPLTLTPTSGVTSTLHITGDNVTNIGCTTPDGTSQSCGSESSNGWTITRTPEHQGDAVIAQLDLQP
jgi:hypothetical protein